MLGRPLLMSLSVLWLPVVAFITLTLLRSSTIKSRSRWTSLRLLVRSIPTTLPFFALLPYRLGLRVEGLSFGRRICCRLYIRMRCLVRVLVFVHVVG